MTITDTAYWTAACRATESERPDALFRDPWAQQVVAGRDIRVPEDIYWAVVVRTLLMDRMIADIVWRHGVRTILNLGAGFDTRPYRMQFPAVKWIEIDFAEVIDRKNDMLPNIGVERLQADLTHKELRDDLLNAIGVEFKNVLVIAEGLMPYLSQEEAASLALSLGSRPSYSRWLVDTVDTDHARHAAAALNMELFGFDGHVVEQLWHTSQFWPLLDAAMRLGRGVQGLARVESKHHYQPTQTSGVALLSNSLQD